MLNYSGTMCMIQVFVLQMEVKNTVFSTSIFFYNKTKTFKYMRCVAIIAANFHDFCLF